LARSDSNPGNSTGAKDSGRPAAVSLARRLALFDVTMLVMGGIVGSGIFINPYVVAQQVHTPVLILAAWFCGGLIALAGAFIYAELAARRPEVGGQYAYIREAYHPALAFIYGWSLLLVTQSGGMAAVAVTFERYFLELASIRSADGTVAASVLVLLTLVNCLGVRAGSTVQSLLMVLKLVAIAALVLSGFLVQDRESIAASILDRPVSPGLPIAFGAAMVPVLFAYGGWQTSSFIAGEMRQPERDLPRGLLLGVAGVVMLYLAVNYVCVSVLGPSLLRETRTPASAVMRRALGDTGAVVIAVGIAVSTLGFLSQSILTAPRVYFAMAEDGVFFRRVAWLHSRTRVPVVAIGIQGLTAMVIALSGRYEQILNYVVSVDFLFFGLTATCIFVFRHREKRQHAMEPPPTEKAPAPGFAGRFRVPGHPFTTLFFISACWLVALVTIVRYPGNSLIGLVLMLTGLPIYWVWRRIGGAKPGR